MCFWILEETLIIKYFKIRKTDSIKRHGLKSYFLILFDYNPNNTKKYPLNFKQELTYAD